MNNNIGGMDKIVRLMGGTGMLAIGVYYQNWWGVVGLIPLVTALVGFCPLYPILGLNTNNKD